MKSRNILLPLFVFLIIVFSSFSFFVLADENKDEKNILLDLDQDGLSDQEELLYGTDPNKADTDGDGYSDGVELKGGYDPLKPAPGDKILSDNEDVKTVEGVGGEQDLAEDENLTEELSKDVAELISDAKLSGEDLNLADIDELVQNTINSSVSFEDLPDINKEDIKIKKQNYEKLNEDERKSKEKEDATEYLTAVSYLAAENFPSQISKTDDLEKISSEFMSQFALLSTAFFNEEYFDDMAKKGEKFLEALKDVEVPESLLDTHIQGMKLANYAISMKSEIKVDQVDPLKSIAQLSKVQGLIALASDYFENVSTQIATMGILEIPLEL